MELTISASDSGMFDPDPNGPSVHVNELSFIRFNGTQKLKRRTINAYCSFIERINSELAQICLPHGLYRPQSGRFYWKRYGQPETVKHILNIIRKIYTIDNNKAMLMRMSPLVSMLNMVSDEALAPWLAVKEQFSDGQPATIPAPGTRLYSTQQVSVPASATTSASPSAYKMHHIRFTGSQWVIEKSQELTEEEHHQFLYELDPAIWIKFKYDPQNPLREPRQRSDDIQTKTVDRFLEQHKDAYYFIRRKDTFLSLIIEKNEP